MAFKPATPIAALPDKPPPNGNKVEAYLVEAVTVLIAEHKRQRETWFKGYLTLGNVISIGAILLAIILFYTKMEAHVADSQIHQSIEQKEASFDSRFALRLEPTLYRITRNEGVIAESKADIAELKDQMNRIEGYSRRSNRILRDTPEGRRREGEN